MSGPAVKEARSASGPSFDFDVRAVACADIPSYPADVRAVACADVVPNTSTSSFSGPAASKPAAPALQDEPEGPVPEGEPLPPPDVAKKRKETERALSTEVVSAPSAEGSPQTQGRAPVVFATSVEGSPNTKPATVAASTDHSTTAQSSRDPPAEPGATAPPAEPSTTAPPAEPVQKTGWKLECKRHVLRDTGRPFMLEIFGGSGTLTRALRNVGVDAWCLDHAACRLQKVTPAAIEVDLSTQHGQELARLMCGHPGLQYVHFAPRAGQRAEHGRSRGKKRPSTVTQRVAPRGVARP